MRGVCKILNPLIWLWNFHCYLSHLETYRHVKVYKRYDFSQDLRYF